MKYPDPEEILQGQLGDWLRWLDDERRAAKRTGLKRLALTVPIICAGLLYSLLMVDGEWVNKVLSALVALGWAYAWARSPMKEILPAVKTEINTEIAKAMDLEYQAFPSANFAFECGVYFSLLPAHDKSSFESLWRGEFEGRAFELIEVHLQKRYERNGSTQWRTVFMGALLSIRTKAEFAGSTLIREKDALRDWSETYTLNGPASPIELGMDPAPTGNAVFDQHFECHSEDPAEANRLVTLDVMNEIGRLKNVFPSGKRTSAVFNDGHFVMIIESGNLFESGSVGRRTDREVVANTIRQFAEIAKTCRAV